jgi:tetratricopeptide (TPR) repeat protein
MKSSNFFLKAAFAVVASSALVACSVTLLPPAHVAKRTGIPDNNTRFPPQVYYHFLAAQSCLGQQNWECARMEFESALAYDNNSSYLRLQLAQMYALSGDFEQAAAWAEKAAVIDPADIDAYYMLIRIYVAQNRPEDAIKQYDTIFSLDPTDEEAYFTLAMLQQQQKRPEDAIATIHKLLKINARSPSAWFFLGNIYMEIGKTGKARTFYLKALDIDPAFEPALINLALEYESDGEIEKSIEALQKVVELNSENYRARDKLALLFLKQDRLKEALENYIYIRDANPEFAAELETKIGLIYYDLEQWTNAEESFAAAVEKNPADDRLQYYHGIALERLKRNHEARLAFSAVHQDSKFYAQARLHLGFILDDEGERERARAVVREAIACEKNDADLYHYLASLYEKDSRIDEGIAVIKEGLTVQPENENLLFYLGILYDKDKRFDESIDVMQEVVRLNKNNAEAFNFIGYSWADRGIHLDEAEKLIKKALKLKPEDGYILDSLGWVYYKQGRIAEALAALEKAVLLAPKDAIIAEHLGFAYLSSRNYERARLMFQKALELDPTKEYLKAKINEISDR